MLKSSWARHRFLSTLGRAAGYSGLLAIGFGCESAEPAATPAPQSEPKTVAPAQAVATVTPPVEPKPADAPPPKPVVCPKAPTLVINDPTLEAEIRKRTRKPEGKLTRRDLLGIKTISLTKAKVEKLDPCVFPLLRNLVYLYLGRGTVVDLSPIETLTKIEDLSITSNPVEDLSALAGLEKMDRLVLSRTQVRDLAPLAGMRRLTELTLSDTPVDDVTPLAGLKKLEKLFIERTRISNVSALKGLTKLQSLHVTGSPIDNPYVRKGIRVVD